MDYTNGEGVYHEKDTPEEIEALIHAGTRHHVKDTITVQVEIPCPTEE